jgi:hypothetical protein
VCTVLEHVKYTRSTRGVLCRRTLPCRVIMKGYEWTMGIRVRNIALYVVGVTRTIHCGAYPDWVKEYGYENVNNKL